MSVGYTSTMIRQKIEHVYQPMWNVENVSIFGYEALVRFPDGVCDGDIEKAFALARTEGTLYEMDTKSITTAISSFPVHTLYKGLLFINVFPSTLLHPHFPLFIRQLVSIFPYIRGRVVFEISETKQEEACWDHPGMKERIALIKESGFTVALDDIGKGAAGLQKIIEFAPNYIKLDRYFANDLSSSNEKQEMVSLLIQYASGKMIVILEGIEQEADFEAAKEIQVPIIQGYLLGFPQKLETLQRRSKVIPS
ncbi:EAL domain-containing protein [Neobacillus sp. 19]|uniref:EAL domain-containing protein n=1 Tax=Neobacillus sp. 19 TaxID=3394458 RepID=UPI003BF6AC12